MNREEVLAKSRAEHKNSDIVEQEVTREGESWSALVILFLAVVFFCVQIATGGGWNYGLYALVFANHATIHWVKYIKFRQKLAWAVMDTLVTLALSAAHLYMLVTGA